MKNGLKLCTLNKFAHIGGGNIICQEITFLTGLDTKDITENEIQVPKEIPMGRQEFSHTSRK